MTSGVGSGFVGVVLLGFLQRGDFSRIRVFHAGGLLLKGDAAVLGGVVRALAPKLGAMRCDVRLALDRDPVSLL